MAKRKPYYYVGLDEDKFRYVLLERLDRNIRYQKHPDDYLSIVMRYINFYDMNLLDFMEEKDIDRFLTYETKVTPLFSLPFREEYVAEGKWVLDNFTDQVRKEKIGIFETEPARWSPVESKPFGVLSDAQIDALLDVVQECPLERLMVIFSLGTGIPSHILGNIKLGNLNLYHGVVTAYKYPQPKRQYALGPLLRWELLEYLEREMVEATPKTPLIQFEGKYHSCNRIFRGIFHEIGIDMITPEGWLVFSFYDQLSKAGGSNVQNINDHRTNLAFRRMKDPEEGQIQAFKSAIHPRLKGYISLAMAEYESRFLYPVGYPPKEV